MKTSRGTLRRKVGILGCAVLLLPIAQAAEQQITDGNYGRVGSYKQWNLTLKSDEWSQTFKMTVDLRSDGLHVRPLESVTADGTAEPYKEVEWRPTAYRASDSVVRFEVPISKLPRPRPGKAQLQPGQTQIVSVELVAQDGQAVARTAAPNRELCPDCASWTVSDFSHSTGG